MSEDTETIEEPGWNEGSLHYAASTGNVDSLRTLLKRKVKVDEVKGGLTALHVASKNGHCDVIELLLERGANIHAMDNDKNTALHHACFNAHKDAVLLLVESHKSRDPDEQHDWINAPNKDGNTPLHLAIHGCFPEHIEETLETYKKRLEITKCLISAGANPNSKNDDEDTPFHEAAFSGNEHVGKYLLELCENDNEKEGVINATNKDLCDNVGKMTPLHAAVRGSHKGFVQLLIENGAEPDMKNEHNFTPLHQACSDGNLGIVQLLLEKGVNVNAVGNDGFQGMIAACEHGHVDVVKALLGCKTIVIDGNHEIGWVENLARCAWEFPKNCNRFEILDLLVKRRADVNKRGALLGVAPLGVALEQHDFEMATYLLNCQDIKLDGIDTQRNTVFHLACKMKSGDEPNLVDDFFDLFLKHAKEQPQNGPRKNTRNVLDTKNKNRKTALMMCASKGLTTLAEKLLKAGASCDIKDKKQRTALDLAKGHPAVETLLQEWAKKTKTQSQQKPNKRSTRANPKSPLSGLPCASAQRKKSPPGKKPQKRPRQSNYNHNPSLNEISSSDSESDHEFDRQFDGQNPRNFSASSSDSDPELDHADDHLSNSGDVRNDRDFENPGNVGDSENVDDYGDAGDSGDFGDSGNGCESSDETGMGLQGGGTPQKELDDIISVSDAEDENTDGFFGVSTENLVVRGNSEGEGGNEDTVLVRGVEKLQEEENEGGMDLEEENEERRDIIEEENEGSMDLGEERNEGGMDLEENETSERVVEQPVAGGEGLEGDLDSEEGNETRERNEKSGEDTREESENEPEGMEMNEGTEAENEEETRANGEKRGREGEETEEDLEKRARVESLNEEQEMVATPGNRTETNEGTFMDTPPISVLGGILKTTATECGNGIGNKRNKEMDEEEKNEAVDLESKLMMEKWEFVREGQFGSFYAKNGKTTEVLRRPQSDINTEVSKVLMSLKHPNIAQLGEYHTNGDVSLEDYHGDKPEIVTGIVYDGIADHPTLASLLEDALKRMRFYWPIRVRVAAGLARAIAYLHSISISHGSISPHSIVISPDYVPRLIDTGVGKWSQNRESWNGTSEIEASRFWTHSRRVREFVARKRFAGWGGSEMELFDFLEDSYSFSVVLLSLLTGKMGAALYVEDEETDGLRLNVGLEADTYFLDECPPEEKIRSCIKDLSKSRNNRFKVCDILNRLTSLEHEDSNAIWKKIGKWRSDQGYRCCHADFDWENSAQCPKMDNHWVCRSCLEDYIKGLTQRLFIGKTAVANCFVGGCDGIYTRTEMVSVGLEQHWNKFVDLCHMRMYTRET